MLSSPGVVQCHLQSLTDLQPQSFPEGLALLEGSALVMAWRLQMFEAMRAGNSSRVRLLWECSQTVTILLRVGGSLGQLTLHAMKGSEDLKLQEKLLADSILTFSSRLAVLLREISEKTIPKKLVKLDQAMSKDQNASGKKVFGDDA